MDRQLILRKQTSEIDSCFINNNNHVSTNSTESRGPFYLYISSKDKAFILSTSTDRSYDHHKGSKLWEYFIKQKASATGG